MVERYLGGGSTKHNASVPLTRSCFFQPLHFVWGIVLFLFKRPSPVLVSVVDDVPTRKESLGLIFEMRL